MDHSRLKLEICRITAWLPIRPSPLAIALCLCAMGTGASAGDNAKPITVAPVRDLTIFPALDAPAIVVSLNDARVSAQAPGVIQGYSAAVGDRVGQGQLLATLNCEEHEIAVEGAEADLEAAKSRQAFAKTQLDSAKKLSSLQGIAKEQVDERQSEYAVATAEIGRAIAALKNAKRLVDHCEIRAPFAGAVVEHLASTGDYATKGMPIIRLVDTDNIEVSASIQEQDLPSLENARELRFFNRRDHFPVALSTVLPFMDSRLRSFEVRLSFTDKTPKPGTSGRLHWTLPWQHVPSGHLVRRGDHLGLFLERDGTARFFPIDDAKPGRPARIDLPPETHVVLDGRHSLVDGDPVVIVDAAEN